MQNTNTPNLETMTDAELGAYYDEHADELRTEHDIAVEIGDVVEFEPDPNASMVLSVRIKGEQIRTLINAAHDAGLPVSTYVREAALAAAADTPAPAPARLTKLAAIEALKDYKLGDLMTAIAGEQSFAVHLAKAARPVGGKTRPRPTGKNLLEDGADTMAPHHHRPAAT